MGFPHPEDGTDRGQRPCSPYRGAEADPISGKWNRRDSPQGPQHPRGTSSPVEDMWGVAGSRAGSSGRRGTGGAVAPGGVSLESSNLCMPDLPHLLAFLSASRDVLPRTLLLPPPTLRQGDEHSGPLQINRVQLDPSGGVLSVVNQLYLETHRDWEMEQTPQEKEPETAQGLSPAPRNPIPHRVSWVEGPLSPEVCRAGPALTSVVEEQEEDVDYKEEEGPEDVLTAHVRALVRARSSYVAKQYRGLRARLTSESGSPHRPGDPATELLQDVRQLLMDLQDHLAKDPDVRAVFGSKGPGVPQKDEDLGPAVEEAVCRAVLAPLKPALWRRLRTLRAQELRRLRRRQIALRAEAGPPGAQGAEPEGQSPAPALRSRIHARLANLHAACAPRRKIALLLAVCSDVYAGLVSGENQEPQGADAFLPALTEELIWSPDIGETQLDVEFLMELLDPDELRGEAGYYLTTWFGALYHIAHYEPDAGRAPQGLSSEARASLRQWHRRRTLHGQDHPGAQVQTGRPWNGHGGSRQPPWLGLVTLMAGRAALSTMASRFLEETSWTIPVRLIAHQHFQLLDVVDQELPEATGQQVLRFLVTAVTDAGHQDLALESSSAPCCQSLWVSASCA
ncbi:ras and Rab interactor-like protein isoform X2 [Tupaia chinensis]|uniref:ras and Rab interactor-like protein isoform X2 n=1 Tax=Tupaia chinensis TaxID=246437 RepID=UPI000FFC2CB3|nr:ras and Rab interactor-like protein isoform X2 [Tupaia chinensis]